MLFSSDFDVLHVFVSCYYCEFYLNIFEMKYINLKINITVYNIKLTFTYLQFHNKFNNVKYLCMMHLQCIWNTKINRKWCELPIFRILSCFCNAFKLIFLLIWIEYRLKVGFSWYNFYFNLYCDLMANCIIQLQVQP